MSTATASSTPRQPQTVASQKVIDHRLANGQCIHCGTQTHSVKRRALRKPLLTPLTIEGQVQNGRCLQASCQDAGCNVTVDQNSSSSTSSHKPSINLSGTGGKIAAGVATAAAGVAMSALGVEGLDGIGEALEGAGESMIENAAEGGGEEAMPGMDPSTSSFSSAGDPYMASHANATNDFMNLMNSLTQPGAQPPAQQDPYAASHANATNDFMNLMNSLNQPQQPQQQDPYAAMMNSYMNAANAAAAQQNAQMNAYMQQLQQQQVAQEMQNVVMLLNQQVPRGTPSPHVKCPRGGQAAGHVTEAVALTTPGWLCDYCLQEMPVGTNVVLCRSCCWMTHNNGTCSKQGASTPPMTCSTGHPVAYCAQIPATWNGTCDICQAAQPGGTQVYMCGMCPNKWTACRSHGGDAAGVDKDV